MKMTGNYVMNIGNGYMPDPKEPILPSLFQEYERVLVESLVSSFGLDFLIKDQHGGDVDTIHNVRQIGKDPQMYYKNKENQKAYEERGKYDSRQYHGDPRYLAQKRENNAQKSEGTLKDGYTGKKISKNEKSDLDHVIPGKEIHEDRGRVLAGLNGIDLANSRENLQETNQHTNRSKNADSMEEYLDKHGDDYTEKQKENMRQKDAIARKEYEAKLAKAYYTSPRFAKDMSFAAGKVGVKMGARQALGFIFAEMWFTVKEEFQTLKGEFQFGEFLETLGRGIKRGFERAKEKYAELFSKFLGGTIAGALSSVVTTLCNIFFTTSKNVVRIIRQSFASLVEAAKVLFINPENYTFGERMRAVAKIIAMGASVVVGTAVSDMVGKTGIAGIPVVGDLVQTFCGAFVSGIMSCTLLYFFDRSEIFNRLVRTLDNIHTVETEIGYFREQAIYFEKYAAELMSLDLDTFKRETSMFGNIAGSIEDAKSEEELNALLKNAFDVIGIKLPWEGYESFDSFMQDKSAVLVFE